MGIKILLDSARLEDTVKYVQAGGIAGITTNPTLMRQSGVTDYEAYAKALLKAVPHLPVALEVFSDELSEMERQARKLAQLGSHVYVKIPVMNTQKISTAPLLKTLSYSGIKVNVTAVFTVAQVDHILQSLSINTPSVISIFAGRIANAGIDPMPIVKEAVRCAKTHPQCEILWASTREALNIKQAEACGCHLITVSPSILKAAKDFGKNLDAYCLETVEMFYQDALAAEYVL